MTRHLPAEGADSLEAAARDLYGLPPGEFTAARNERAKRARAQGNADAARAIAKLARPSVVAWLANQLVRQHAGEIRQLLDVGAAMRQATAALDAGQLRQLSGRRQDTIRMLVGQARDLAGSAGQAFSDGTARDLEATLHAALADEEAAAQLTSGQLATGLSHTGFPGIGTDASGTQFTGEGTRPTTGASERDQGRRAPGKGTPAKGAPGQGAPTAVSEDAARRERAVMARQDEAQARRDAEEAIGARAAAKAALAGAEQHSLDVAATIDRLRSELDAALAARADAARAERQARKSADLADRMARQAELRLQAAAARVRDL